MHLLSCVQSYFCRVIMSYFNDRSIPGLFGTQDENRHRMLVRRIVDNYSMSNLVFFEGYMDPTMRISFEQHDKRYVAKGKICNFGV